MTFTFGVVLFAVAIGLSIALHEFGHLLTAKAFGMQASEYFVGFGPRIFSFRRGETEYGLKALPVGGYVKIVGMTPTEEVAPADQARAFWRFPAWKRTIVLVAGSATHFLIALVAIFAAAVSTGLPTDKAVVGDVQSCAPVAGQPDGKLPACGPGDPVSPAAAAGLRAGDRITAVNGQPVASFEQLVGTLRSRPGQTVQLTWIRDGREQTGPLSILRAQRSPRPGERAGAGGLATVGVVGLGPAATETFGAGAAVGQTFRFTGSVVAATFGALKNFPQKVPDLGRALTGAKRDPEGPVSVVGVSRAGGQALQAGSVGWTVFILLFASFNIFVGVFNLFPLLPLDGGHVAVLLFEKVRSWLARLAGRADPGRVDYAKLMPLTALVIVVFGGISLLAILADIVNPIDLFQQ